MRNEVIYFILLNLVLMTCESVTNSPDQTQACNPDSNVINLIFKYGSGETKNILNSFNCSFTKDMICDPPIDITVQLSPIEMDHIYGEMVRINFFNFPDTLFIDLPDSLRVHTTPYSTFYFYIETKLCSKELFWQMNITGPDPKILDSIHLTDMIIGRIESKDGYMALPQPRCGYD